MMDKGSICHNCFHSYVCEQFNEHRDSGWDNKKCHFFNDHFVDAENVVEVVRCKDCKSCFINPFGEESNVGVCNKRGVIGLTVQLDDYCSYGERRETNAE